MRKKFIIPCQLWGLNEHLNACKSKYGQHLSSKYKRETEEFIGWCIKKDLGNWKAKTIVYIKYRWIEPNKKRDLSNIAFGKKYIEDALVKSGVLKNDGWKDILGFEDSFAVDKDNPRIEVEIIEIC